MIKSEAPPEVPDWLRLCAHFGAGGRQCSNAASFWFLRESLAILARCDIHARHGYLRIDDMKLDPQGLHVVLVMRS